MMAVQIGIEARSRAVLPAVVRSIPNMKSSGYARPLSNAKKMPRRTDQGCEGVGYHLASIHASRPMVNVESVMRRELKVMGSSASTADLTTVMLAPQITVVRRRAASARKR